RSDIRRRAVTGAPRGAGAEREGMVMNGLELSPTRASDRLGLASAGRAAAVLSREITFADPDPVTLTELDDRLHRYATTLFSAPHTTLVGPVIADWRRVQAALGRRLSPTVHAELTRVAGYLSFSLGMLAVDTGDDTSARRFATLTEQFAAQLDDRLLTGTAHSLDAAIAFVTGRYAAARNAAAKAAAVDHPYLHGWAAAVQVTVAAATGDEAALDAALNRLRHRPTVLGLRHPGWPPFDEVREACVVADAMARLGMPGARSAAYTAIDLTTPATLDRGWALASLAATTLRRDPAVAQAALLEVEDILDKHPSRVLTLRMNEILMLTSAHAERASRRAGAA
ncbi:hypothetical protein, partial [Frankia casuarinae]|uniref:hypothetical protein n=1 Tax=Frankia casuarinae (strain DSM 45818 / CECT 9043 / HFP020203 / CcI3) TaxID=106370 RepID=UPI003100BF85